MTLRGRPPASPAGDARMGALLRQWMEPEHVRRLLAISWILACTVLVGCSSAAPADEGAQAGGGMGTGMGGGEGVGMLAGAVAASRNASMSLGSSASTSQGVQVATVLAPSDGWLVVRSATSPGGVLGKTWVPKGQSRSVLVKLDAADGADVRVALHVDQGARQEFEFDPARPELSLDKPIVVERQPLEQPLSLTGYGVEAMANSVLMLVEDQSIKSGTLTVRYLILPGPAWISVNLLEDGVPGRQVGLALRPAGESQEVSVAVEAVAPAELVVSVLADRGAQGVFEFNGSDPLNSLDQPFKSAGVAVSHRIEVK